MTDVPTYLSSTGPELTFATFNGLTGPKGTCFISGNTVTSVCMQPGQRGNCEVMHRSTVPVQHRTISGTVSTTNLIMANWSTQMWQDVMNRVARSLASGHSDCSSLEFLSQLEVDR
ncbi:hypothetical protein KIN20_013662 [Parelaphostrongylus tenuis]|uniref:Uncharacterized protein n=1 Tax=Parelaphostrongylus tenuis TaxID=148309 RepID=A0AAD5MH13_PARTN|nr:hypothetical protein KIN20_013662 [Parelaphostrongylus tenuis]